MSGAPALAGRDHGLRSLAVPCPQCRAWTELRVGTPAVGTPAVDAPERLACAACRADIPLDFRAHVGPSAQLDGCPACGYHTLYVQKDFNGKLGVLLVLAVFMLLLVLGLPLVWLLAALVAFAALDWLLLRFVIRRRADLLPLQGAVPRLPAGAHLPALRPGDLRSARRRRGVIGPRPADRVA